MSRDEFARLWPEIHREVSRTLTDEGVAWWLNLYIPGLGSTVAAALRSGRADDVLALTASYLDPSFA